MNDQVSQKNVNVVTNQHWGPPGGWEVCAKAVEQQLFTNNRMSKTWTAHPWGLLGGLRWKWTLAGTGRRVTLSSVEI